MNLNAIRRAAAVVVVGGVIAAVITGLRVLGPPREEHERKIDAQRVRDLQQLASALDSYLARHGRLADSAEMAAGEFNVGTVVRDPETNQPYRYRVLGGDHYELCADFRRPSQPDRLSQNVGFWSHGGGTHCFALTAKGPFR